MEDFHGDDIACSSVRQIRSTLEAVKSAKTLQSGIDTWLILRALMSKFKGKEFILFRARIRRDLISVDIKVG